ncbi:recombinational DNA repair ATPase RecF [Streptomyces canus]|nr:recombinational DNA repair ATPase RecF [Streptomyces canus]
MQLSRVRVKNFRNFEDLTIDPFPSPAVIVGENGVGKSNLLAALRLVLDPDLLDRHRVHEYRRHPRRRAQPRPGVEVRVEIELWPSRPPASSTARASSTPAAILKPLTINCCTTGC